MTDKAPQPTFFTDPALDWCWSTILSLSAEVAALRDRMETLEAVAVRRGVLLAGEVDSYEMEPAEADERRARREQFTARVFQALDREFAGLEEAT